MTSAEGNRSVRLECANTGCGMIFYRAKSQSRCKQNFCGMPCYRRQMSRGEKNWRAKLTWDDVIAIREHYERGKITLQEIADHYGVWKTTISAIVRGVNWSL